MKSEKRDYDNLALAKFWAQRKSKDPSTKTGAVITRPDGTVASLGYNGFPKGMADTEERLSNREEKYSRVVHCEINALHMAHESCRGYTLYTWPIMSCDRCAVQVIQAGIVRVVAPHPSEDALSRWGKSLKRSLEFFDECGVKVDLIEFTE